MLKLLVLSALVAGASAGVQGIKTCTSATVDVTCDAGFSLEATATCTACPMPAASVCGAGMEPMTATAACPDGNTNAFVTATNDATRAAGGCVTCSSAGKFDHATEGCTACRPNAATCSSLTVDTTCKVGSFLDANASGGATCMQCTAYPTTGADGDVCYEDAVLKLAKPAAERCDGSTTSAPSNADAAAACKACPAGKFSAGANAVGCTDCDENCAACNSGTVCTNAAAGHFLDSTTTTGETNPTTCTAAADATLCTAHATLKLAKSIDDLCVAGNSETSSPDVSDAAGACKGCGAGTFANAEGTAGCGPCVPGDLSLCTAHATLKVLKTADDLCAAGNSETSSPAVGDAAAACKVCPAGKFPNAEGTPGCTACDTDSTSLPADVPGSATSASVGAAALLVATVAARFQ